MYRIVQRLARENAAYLAGLIDGEGTITLTADHPGERRAIEVTPRNGKYCEDVLRMKAQFERDFLAIGPGPRYRRG